MGNPSWTTNLSAQPRDPCSDPSASQNSLYCSYPSNSQDHFPNPQTPHSFLYYLLHPRGVPGPSSTSSPAHTWPLRPSISAWRRLMFRFISEISVFVRRRSSPCFPASVCSSSYCRGETRSEVERGLLIPPRKEYPQPSHQSPGPLTPTRLRTSGPGTSHPCPPARFGSPAPSRQSLKSRFSLKEGLAPRTTQKGSTRLSPCPLP